MSTGLLAVIWGIITFSILVVLHEGGHFLAARAFGVKVHEFMIGLPGPSLRLHGKKTTYGVTAIPLGGYVRIAGMEPGPEDELLAQALASATRRGEIDAETLAGDLGVDEARADGLLFTLADWDAIEPLDAKPARDEVLRYRSHYEPAQADDARALLDRARVSTYRGLSTPRRIIVLSAGVVVNLLTAVAVLSVVISGWGIQSYSMKVSTIAENSAAEKAGMVAGDRITAVNEKKVRDWQTLLYTLGRFDPGESITVTFVHAGQAKTVEVTLGDNPEITGEQAFLGVGPSVVTLKPTPIQAVGHAVGMIGMVFQAIGAFFNPETFQVSVRNSTSVIGVSYMAAEAARRSALDYAWLIALLSLSLGAMNILPIPPLDGGKVAMELIERGIGHPVSRRLAIAVSASGTLLLFVLIGYLMYSDVVKFVANG